MSHICEMRISKPTLRFQSFRHCAFRNHTLAAATHKPDEVISNRRAWIERFASSTMHTTTTAYVIISIMYAPRAVRLYLFVFLCVCARSRFVGLFFWVVCVCVLRNAHNAFVCALLLLLPPHPDDSHSGCACSCHILQRRNAFPGRVGTAMVNCAK